MKVACVLVVESLAAEGEWREEGEETTEELDERRNWRKVS